MKLISRLVIVIILSLTIFASVYVIKGLYLSFLLWLFVLSENEYIISTDIPIEVRNLPAQLVLNEKVPKFAKIRIKGEGR